MGKSVNRENVKVENHVVVFESVQDLYKDMLSMQSFIVSQNTYNGRTPILEGYTIYRHVELKHGKLNFHGNKFGGSELAIKGKFLSMKKLDNIDACLSEYYLMIDGSKELLVLMALKKSQH